MICTIVTCHFRFAFERWLTALMSECMLILDHFENKKILQMQNFDISTKKDNAMVTMKVLKCTKTNKVYTLTKYQSAGSEPIKNYF